MSKECVCEVLAQNTLQIIFYSMLNLPLFEVEQKRAVLVWVPLNANELLLMALEGGASRADAPSSGGRTISHTNNVRNSLKLCLVRIGV